MFRWLFFLLLIANAFPAFMSGNTSAYNVGSENQVVDSDDFTVRTIRLLSESSAVGNENEGPGEAIQLLPQRRESLCFLIGPLASMAKAETFAQEVEDSGMEISRRWREVSVGTDYWVYLPQLPSVRATTRTLQELKANDIDGFIFSEGDLKGAVALGIFTELEVAESRKEDFIKLGYDARLYKMDRLAREYWLMSEKMPRPGTMEALINSRDLSEIPQKISRRDCKTVASAMQFQ